MIEELFDLKKKIECETIMTFHFNFNIEESGEIIFNYTILKGFETVKTEDCLFNACDMHKNFANIGNKYREIEKELLNA